jgi:peroxiredoxin
LQRVLPEIKSLGGQLIAISPQLPDQSLEMVLERGLDFMVLSDVDNQVARDFGLVYTIPSELRDVYSGLGIDIEEANGNKKFELPFPATYVANKNGDIVLDFVDVDHTKRLEPSEIISALEAIAT